MATDPNNPLAQYGYNNQTAQQLADSLGLTPAQLAAAFAATPQNSVSQPQSGQSYGKAGPGPTMGRDLGQTISQLQIAQAAGLGGNQGAQSGQPPSSTPGGISNDPMNAAVNLGAQALGAAGFSGAEGAFPVYNPTPGQINNAKGGVSNVPSPVSASQIPTGATPNVASVFGAVTPQSQGLQYWQQQGGGGSPADAAAIEKAQGMAPGTIGQQFYQAGVQAGKIQPLNPAPTAGGTPTPVMPANAAGAQSPATPFATAPPAPGIQAVPPAVHHDALQNAGQALYAHMTGGDPATATHADIANFHTQLTSMLGAQTGSGPVPGANYTAGVNQPPSALPPRQMATGGMVPGRGNRDTVPALLTPGEYVIPKQQAAQIFGGRQPVRMQDGGFVQDDSSSDDLPEVRKKRLAVASAVAQAMQQTGGDTGQQSSSQAPAAPGGYTGPTAQQLAQQYGRGPYAASAPPTDSSGYGPLPAGVSGYVSDPGDSGLPAGVSGYVADTGSGGAAAGAGAGAAAGSAAGVAGGLASGLAAAAQKYAESIKSWTWQPQQFASAPSAPSGPAAQLTQDTDVETKKKRDAMQIAQMGFNPYQG